MAMIGEQSAPDWKTISDKIRCPLCEYDLRGLSDPRCPECGFTFRWDEILDRTRRRHPYLFEHHPEKNLSSFIKTAVGGLAPWRFWKNLHPTQRPDLRRLGLYRSMVLAVTWLPFIATLLTALIFKRTFEGFWVRVSISDLLGYDFGDSTSWPKVLFGGLFDTSAATFVLLMTLLLLALPALTAFPLVIFQTTMRQAKVEHHHVQRCIIYSFDFVVWPAVMIALLAAVNPFVTSRGFLLVRDALAWLLLLMFPVVWAVMIVRLAFACRCYLRLRHALGVVLACGSIVLLLLMGIVMFVGELILNG